MSETPKKIYGIDLGTTYSAIAHVDGYGKAQVISSDNSERIIPSVVFFDPDEKDKIHVGQIAKDSAKTDPGRVVDFVKRNMSDKDWTFSIDGKELKPETLSSYILRELARGIGTTGEHEVKDVVITCPAYFGDFERQRTRDAGELAGFNVIAILDEPVAAAINYGLNDSAKGKNIIVYDLGGGTFDITVVQIGEDESITVVCTEGSHQLGGYNWDQRVVLEYVSQSGDSNILDDPENAYDLRLGAEKDKKAISKSGKATGKHAGVKVELTREKFDEITADLLEQTITLTDQALEIAKGKGVNKIDIWLLVGGSTRMPQVKDRLIEKYGLTLGKDLLELGPDADEAVAKGAAKFGGIKIVVNKIGDAIVKKIGDGKSFEDLSEAEQEKVVEEVALETGETRANVYKLAITGAGKIRTVASKSYGIRALNANDEPVVFNLIVKQTQVPVESGQIFGTRGANATSLDLVVYLNDIEDAEASLDMSSELGTAELPLDGNLPEGSPIEIIFNLDDQGKLILTGIDKTHGKKITADFQSDGVMTEEEKQAAKKQSRDIKIGG